MASAYGIARTYNEFVPPVDLNLLASDMETKQNRFDTNFAAIQQQVDALYSLDLLKEEDQAYVADRAQKLVNEINNYGRIDLSSTAVATQVSNHIRQVIDPNVKNALVSTQKYRQFQSEVENIKKTNKDAYSKINEMYSLQPFISYLNDGKVGSKLENLNYHNYVDVQGKMAKLLESAYTKYGETTSQQFDPNNPWAILETETGGIESEKIRRYVEANLNPEDRQQLAINGWYKYGLSTPEKAQEVLKNQSDAYIEQIDFNIKNLENSKKGASKQEIEKYNNAIQNYKFQKQNIKNIQESLKTPSEIASYMEKEILIGGMQEMYGQRLLSQKYTKNEVYATQMDYNLKKSNADRDYALSLQKFRLDERKQLFEESKFQAEQKTKGLNADGTINPNYIPSTTVIEDNTLEGSTVYNRGIGEINTNRSNLQNQLEEVAKQNGIPIIGEGVDLAQGVTKEDYYINSLRKKGIDVSQYKKTADDLNAKRNAIGKQYDNITNSDEKLIGKDNLLSFYKYKYEKASDAMKPYYKELFNHYAIKSGAIENSLKLGKSDFGMDDVSDFDVKEYKNRVSIDVNLKENQIKAVKFLYQNAKGRSADYEDFTKRKFGNSIDLNKISQVSDEEFMSIMGITEEKLKDYKRNASVLRPYGEFSNVVDNLYNNYIEKPFKENDQATKQSLKDIGLLFTEEYGTKGRVISPSNNKQLYDVVFSQFGLSEIKTDKPFNKEEDIVLKKTEDGKVTAYQKYLETKGDDAGKTVWIPSTPVSISSLDPALRNIVESGDNTNLNVSSTTQVTSSNVGYENSNTTFIALTNSNEAYNQVVNVVGDNFNLDVYKGVVDNPTNYKMVYEDGKLNVKDSSNTTIYTFKYTPEEAYNIYYNIVVPEPSAFVGLMSRDIIQNYPLTRVAPSYFKK